MEAKFQIQERLVTEIIDDLEEALHPKGIGIYMRGTHLCKVMRGAKKDGVMTTCDLRGCFKARGAKEEFLQEVKR